MKFLLLGSFVSYLAIALSQSDPLSIAARPPYLTAEDFERGRLLTTNEWSWNVTHLHGHFAQHAETRANVWIGTKYKWPNAKVPYIISPRYNNHERAVIAEAIREWESKTCIRFIPAAGIHPDYLELTPDDGTSNYCYSHVGRQGGRQYVKMYAPTCMSVGQYVHELGHAIGFGHEHQRPDRDQYVQIKWENVDPQFYYAFDKYSPSQFSTMGMVYDYYSIMHYPDYSYTSTGRPTIVPTYPGHNIANMNVVLTPTDVEKTKKYYSC